MRDHNMPNQTGQWRVKPLLLCHLIVACLLSSLIFPWTQSFWQTVDIAFFKWVNSSLRDRPVWQLFWACANHKLADWVEDLCILGFFIAYVRKKDSLSKKRKMGELLFSAFYIALILYFVNRILFRETWTIPRLSPTLVVEDSVRLSQEIPWMSIKDDSSKSFPGDHATTALLFAATFSFLNQWRLKIPAILYGAFLCMPRLITGAHWLSDVVVGSGSITLFCLSWAFYTPLFQRGTALFEFFLRKPKPQKEALVGKETKL